MIISKLKGGLGNQLFQYAIGRSLSERYGTDLKLDVSWYTLDHQETTNRSFVLDVFDIDYDEATQADIHDCVRFGKVGVTLVEGLGVLRPLGAPLFNYYYEAQSDLEVLKFGVASRWQFQPAVLDAGPDVVLDGFWQTEEYFSDIADLLREEITVSTPLEGKNRNVADKITETDSVSLHVRRGDYVTIGNSLPVSYYENAVANLVSTMSDPHIFVFSDDIAWSRSNLDFPFPVTFVDHNHGDTAHEDFRLMRRCSSHIISNSTFSWWAAWLNAHPEKTVIAPSYWWDGKRTQTLDVIPDRWTLVEP